MKLDADKVKMLITAIGFLPQDGKTGIYHKVYALHDGYTIFVDFNQEKFIYDADTNPQNSNIAVLGKTTSNFSQAENLVVLECVDRLLEKGYAPSSIELEKVYPSGRGHSGRLDILVKAADGTPFLMIECKTWGSEYEKERSKMSQNGGQLFTYYCSARAARYLCLYTSRIDTAIEYRNSIVDVEDTWPGLSEVKDIYGHWNKNFRDNGIFDSYAAPYDIKHRALTYGELEILKEKDSGKIYNQIMEILRHNAISDKPNAFNKLLNLFVCKIIDEDKNPEDELDFQWLESDTDESLQLRLNDLYKEGMWRFLEIRVIDYSQDDVTQRLANLDPTTRQWIMEMYTNTRLKKSPNFAFVEVQDERTFALNAKVVREIVELLQVYKFRYAQRHEFLGNFFELLLNTSMKQEAGQYFTPVPITRFILSALPLKKFVQDRVNSRDGQPIPTVIDYACGSGHFLTEYMSQMQNIIDSDAIDLRRATPTIRNLFQFWKSTIKFRWAEDTVYGIDLDNRLVKTTKVSAFFNGDGDANIVWANGLDHFTKSETYRDKLKRASGQDNGQFDILISNPPYSVDSFKGTIAYGKESFTLYSYLTDNSSEIECLFVERMKQLLKIGGWGAVILPSSILTNGGIHARAREILLKYFRFKAIVELGSGTFMKTGTNTVILFVERRSEIDYENITKQIDQFFVSKSDVAVAKLESAFAAFVSVAYDGLTLGDYLSIFSGAPTENAKSHELYLDYQKAYGENFSDKAIPIEKEKMLSFLLTHDQEIVLVRAGKGKEEKKFLGYEFSERRGHEGLHWLPGGTMLYDEADPLNPRKASGYIYHVFLGEKPGIDPSLEKHMSYGHLCQFIEYGTSRFERTVNLRKTPSSFIKYPLVSLSAVSEKIYAGGDVPKDSFSKQRSERYPIPIYSNGVENDGLYGYTSQDCVGGDPGSITISARGTIGFSKLRNEPFCPVIRLLVVVPKIERVLPKYFEVVFPWVKIGSFGKTTPQLTVPQASQLKIPLPPLGIQQQIVDEIEALEREEAARQQDVENLRQRLLKPEYFQFGGRRIGDIAIMAKRGKSAKYGNSKVQIIKSGQARGYLEFDFSEKHFVADSFVPDERKLEKGDILINSTGVGTAGRVTLFDLNGDFVVDSHITIVRLDRSQALPKYVLYALANIGFDQIEAMADGQSGQIELPLDTILGIRVPLPSPGEQQKIVAEIQQAEDQIAQMGAQLDALKAEKDAVLKKYL